MRLRPPFNGRNGQAILNSRFTLAVVASATSSSVAPHSSATFSAVFTT